MHPLRILPKEKIIGDVKEEQNKILEKFIERRKIGSVYISTGYFMISFLYLSFCFFMYFKDTIAAIAEIDAAPTKAK